MKLCLFQGTFNPPHNAHLRLAKYIADNFDYDKFIVIPASIPPHKNNINVSFDDRYNMTKLLFENLSKKYKIEVSDIENHLKQPSYTYRTICTLYEKYNLKEKPKFIIGEDAFIKIESWYETDKLKNLIDFILLNRGENLNDNTLLNLKNKGYNYTKADLPYLEISSTEIRNNIKNGKALEGLIPKEIQEYINDRKLYKTDI